MAKKKLKPCNCAKLVDKKLTEFNTQLSRSFTISGITYLNVATERIDTKKRKQPKTVVCSHCPFCGKKLPE